MAMKVTKVPLEVLKERKKIGLRILYYRKLNRYTQKELSAKSGVPLTSISRLERGDVTVTLQALMLLAQALNINYREFFN